MKRIEKPHGYMSRRMLLQNAARDATPTEGGFTVVVPSFIFWD
jgi:hypothetical protein